MKKLLFLLVTGSVLVLALFLGCDNFMPPDGHNLSYSTDLERKDVLALKHLQIPNVSEDTLASYVMDFINITAASETGTERSVQPAPAVAITKTTEIIHPVETDFAETTADKRSARSVIGPGQIPFYVFTLENQQTGETGFALTCGDNRIGHVLAVAEAGNYDDDNPFLSVFYSQLNAYIEETIGIYNSVTEADIANALNKMNENARGATAPGLPVTDVGEIEGLIPTGEHKQLKTVLWHQYSPYNQIINNVRILPIGYEKDYQYITGCVPTAIAIIMAYHQVPGSSKALGYTHVKYDWKKMKEGNDDYAIGVLMYEIGLLKNANSNYTMGYVSQNNDKLKKGKASTSTYINNARIAYRNMGYSDPGNFKKYEFSGIKSSIDSGKPVQVSGSVDKGMVILGIPIYKTGHSWVIDGYSQMAATIKDKNNGDPKPSVQSDYVHCNLGWTKIATNGWYFSGIFDIKHIPWDDSKGDIEKRSAKEDGFYQYNIQMLTDIKPK